MHDLQTEGSKKDVIAGGVLSGQLAIGIGALGG